MNEQSIDFKNERKEKMEDELNIPNSPLFFPTLQE